MRTIPLVVSLLALALAGCQGADDASAPAPVATPEAAPTAAVDCSPLGPPTVVRYHSRVDSVTQHNVHLLNSGADASVDTRCQQQLPLAGMVTLSYRVAGG